MVDIRRKITPADIKLHIKEMATTIKKYRAKAKQLNAAASELAKSSARLKRELKKHENIHCGRNEQQSSKSLPGCG